MAGAKQPVLAAIAAAVLLSAAGCGGGGGSKGSSTAASATQPAPTTTAAAPARLGKAAYVKRMQAIGRSLSQALNSVSTATTPASAATGLARAQTQLRAAADKIHSILPPPGIKSEHAQLERGVRDFANELGPVITKLRAGTLAALSTIGTLKGAGEIAAAATAIANKGYKIGG